MTNAAIYMFVALALYTYAVLSGRKEGLKGKHLLAFGLGLTMDSRGTYLMSALAAAAGGTNPLHLWTGFGGLFGMGFHFLLALGAAIASKVTGQAEKINRTFHKVSLFIYLLWVIAFVSGMVVGMLGIKLP